LVRWIIYRRAQPAGGAEHESMLASGRNLELLWRQRGGTPSRLIATKSEGSSAFSLFHRSAGHEVPDPAKRELLKGEADAEFDSIKADETSIS
jgi:hypothetical protein